MDRETDGFQSRLFPMEFSKILKFR